MSRFSQAVSEGDGISVIPVLGGDVAALAAAAEAAGAEAVAVDSPDDAGRVRAAVSLPVLLREPVRTADGLRAARESGADACILAFDDLAEEGELLEDLHAAALEHELDCAVDVRDEDELARVLERIDPDIVLISKQADDRGEEELERALDLLPDVPVGKLVIADSAAVVREQVVALERAGVDAVIVRDLGDGPAFGGAVEGLVGGSGR